tara:strand:+ start:235934 stop:236983 length:1050 start_codon:yes stop_codon:yes gene_type:complete
MVSTSDFYACSVNANNIKYLPDLIDGQAKHHHSNFTGNSSTLRRDFIKAAQPTANIQLIYHRKMGTKPIGYMAYNETITEQGKGLYLEDIYIADHVRHSVRGAGSYGFYELIDTAIQGQMNYVQWSVAMNNEAATFYFYENKIGAERLNKVLYDMDNALFNSLTPRPELNNPSLNARCAAKADLKAIRTRIESYNKTAKTPLSYDTDTLMDNISSAINHHNGDVYLSVNKASGINGLCFVNSNYSTFRNITGIKAEPLIALTDDANLYQQAHYVIADKVIQDSHASMRTGHLIWGVNSADSLAHRFMTAQSADVLLMEGNNIGSTLVMYGIKDKNISVTKRDSLIPKKP